MSQTCLNDFMPRVERQTAVIEATAAAEPRMLEAENALKFQGTQ